VAKHELTFFEAVKALHEKRCEKIKSEFGYQCALNLSGVLCFVTGNGAVEDIGIRLTPKVFLGKWRLMSIKPIKRKVVIENVTWVLGGPFDGGVIIPHGYFSWPTLAAKPPMRMTLEWEE